MHLRSHSSFKGMHDLRSIDLDGQNVVLESSCSTKEKTSAVNNNILLFNNTNIIIIGGNYEDSKSGNND